MAGGQSEEPGDRTWQVNPDAGTLQGWGAFSSPVEAAPVQPHVHYDVAKTPGDEEGDDVVDACKLQALLCDNGALFEVCQHAVRIATQSGASSSQLTSVEMLQIALNHICRHCGIDSVDREEADELWDGPMDVGVFYQFAREYFSSLCRVLTMDVSLLQNGLRMEAKCNRNSWHWTQQIAVRRGGGALIQLPPGGFGTTEMLVPLAVEWLKDLKLRARLDEKTFSAAIASCGNGPEWQRALHLLDVMQANGLEARAAAFTAAIWACSKKQEWSAEAQRRELAIQLLGQMQAGRIRPYDGTCAALVACELDWPRALGHVLRMRARGLTRLSRAHIAAASLCESMEGNWAMSLELLETSLQPADLSEAAKLPEVFPAQRSAFCRSRQWRFAVQAHLEAKRHQLSVSLDAYNQLMKAYCARAGHWQEVLDLLSEICNEDLAPDGDSYDMALKCCSDASEWACVVQLYEELTLYNLPRRRVHALAANACEQLGVQLRLGAFTDPEIKEKVWA
ncbi:unnamed protein product [Symbiodinium microadriaticum]|nr:unnamed protein product [Symbiodinium microadriaticum]